MNKTKIKPQDFLSKLALFNEMGPQELDRIASGTSEMHVQRGETLFQRGDVCNGFHTVIYGQVKLAFTSSQGSEKIVEIIGPGHSFGEAIMFMDKPYIVAAQALADTLLLHISKAAVLAELEQDPLFARKMLAGLSRRLHGLICDVEAYSLYSGTQRVIGYLLQHGSDADTQSDRQQIVLPFSKAVLASRLNLTPEHFSRILHDLSENQLINVSGKNITILNIEKLRTYEG
ncbi:MAG: Crp/Fnr family transcriptional regulator [Glaciimonas sp.]|nr:Crp/Fnr family transcriptional regulator [Glaciimonas sp.]